MQMQYSRQPDLRGQALQTRKGPWGRWLSNVLPTPEFASSRGHGSTRIVIWPAAFARYAEAAGSPSPVYELTFDDKSSFARKTKCTSWDGFPGTFQQSQATKQGLLPELLGTQHTGNEDLISSYNCA